MRHVVQLSAVSAGMMLLVSSALGSLITPGNPVVMRIDGTGLGSPLRGAPVFIEEYDANSGALVQSFPMPTSGSSALTLEHITAQDGVMSATVDKSKIIFGGYRYNAQTDPATIGAQTPLSAATPRVIGSVSATGVVDTSYTVTGFNLGALRGVASVDGTSFYMATGSTNQGVSYVAASGGTPVQIANPNKNSRNVALANINGTPHTLISSDGLGSGTDRVRIYGQTPVAGLPGSALFTIGGTGEAVQGLAFLDLNPSIPGDDTLYLVQNGQSAGVPTGTNPGVQKWTFDGTTWNLTGSIAHAAPNAAGLFHNLAAFSSGADVNLFMTGEFGLYKLTDTSGYGGTLSGTASLLTGLSSTGAVKFRGVAVVPEPASFGVLAAAALFTRRRR